MGVFIAIEGIECAGKTTQIQRVAHALHERGYHTLIAREPGGSEIGEHIRSVLKDPAHRDRMHALTSLFLFNASRKQFVEEVVKPALARDNIVIADRFVLSTLAYQGHAEGLPLDFVRSVCLHTAGDCMPRKTYLLDISVREMKRRLAARTLLGEDRYDHMDMSFHEKVRTGYLAEWEKDKAHIERVDGEGEEREITERLLQKIMPLLSSLV